MKVPFVDLRTQYADIQTDVMAAIEGVLDSTQFILGEEVDRFEKEFAEFCGAQHTVGVANGTDAIHLALRALGVGPGDEVITAANTFAATAFAINYTGAQTVVVDVRPDDYTIDVELIEEAITPRTKAIVPVHLYGHPARMGPILAIAEKHGLFVVEDACQAHGATYLDQRVGALGSAGCFSFYPGKNLGAFGDGGAVVTNDAALADRLRLMRNYGQRVKNEHSMTGYNSRLDTLQAAVLLVKLARLEEWTRRRQSSARRYRQLLTDSELILPEVADDVEHVFHLFVVRHPQRDALQRHLADRGIASGVHYPRPIHHASPFQDVRTVPHGVPVASTLAGQIVSLPMFPELTEDQIQLVCNSVRSFATEQIPA